MAVNFLRECKYVVQMMEEDSELEEIRMKYGHVQPRPFECDYQCEEGFNLSLRLKKIQYVDF